MPIDPVGIVNRLGQEQTVSFFLVGGFKSVFLPRGYVPDLAKTLV